MSTTLGRLRRSLWPGHNELCRGSDRIEAAMWIVALLVALLALPVAGAIGSQTYTDMADQAQRQRAERHQITATLTEDAAVSPAAGRGSPGNPPVAVHATWTTDTGTRSGTVVAPPGARRGTTVPVWVDGRGAVVTAPITEADAVGGAVATAIALWVSVLGLLLAVLTSLHAVLGRGRAAAWQREWLRVEPRWRHHTR